MKWLKLNDLSFRFLPTFPALLHFSLPRMTKGRWDENRTEWFILSSNKNGLAHGSVHAGLWCWLWGQGLLGQISWWPRWEGRQEVSAIGYFAHSIHVKTLIIHWTLQIVFSVLSLHRDTCRLIIRKIQFAPDNTGSGQKAELCKSFMMSDKPVFLEASLEKEVCNLWCTSSFDIYHIKKKLMCLFVLITDLLPRRSHPGHY